MDIFKLIASIFSGLLKWWNNKTLKDAGKDEAAIESRERHDEQVADINDATNDDRVRERIKDKYFRD